MLLYLLLACGPDPASAPALDQDQDGWFYWNGDAWDAVGAEGPVVRHPHFTGTGTRAFATDVRGTIFQAANSVTPPPDPIASSTPAVQ